MEWLPLHSCSLSPHQPPNSHPHQGRGREGTKKPECAPGGWSWEASNAPGVVEPRLALPGAAVTIYSLALSAHLAQEGVWRVGWPRPRPDFELLHPWQFPSFLCGLGPWQGWAGCGVWEGASEGLRPSLWDILVQRLWHALGESGVWNPAPLESLLPKGDSRRGK